MISTPTPDPSARDATDAPHGRVSVIICAFSDERWDELTIAIESVAEQRCAPREIIVAIDHNDALARRAAAAYPDVTVVASDQPKGLSGTRNCGVAHASGEILAFLDDDAWAEPDWLECLIAHYDRPEVFGVGGSIVPMWPTERPLWFPHEFDWVVGCTYRGLPAQTATVRNLIGANMSFRREVFERVGGFVPGIGREGSTPVGGEETLLCIRVSIDVPEAQFIFEPTAVVHHLVPSSRAAWRYFRRRCFAEGISKSKVSAYVGDKLALASERKHLARELPRGMAGELREAGIKGSLRVGAMAAGSAFAVAGYSLDRARRARDTVTGRA